MYGVPPRTCEYLRGIAFGVQGRIAHEGQDEREELHCLVPRCPSPTPRRFHNGNKLAVNR
jgi:hypothetical protein